MIGKLLFRMAKAPFMGAVAGNAFRYFSWAIPVKKVYSSRSVLAFRHPRPTCGNHVVLSPKRAIRNLQALSADGLHLYLADIFQAAQEISRTDPAYHDSFVLLGNGGKRQEVQQVHFHLFTQPEMVHDAEAEEPPESILSCDGALCIMKPLHPDWEVHFVLKPLASPAGNDAYFRSILRSIDVLDAEFKLVQNGYALICQHGPRSGETVRPVFHIVSGRRINRP